MPRRLLPLLLCLAIAACKKGDPEPPPGCTTHEECGEGQLCAEDGTCVAGAECTKDIECGDARKFCDTETFKCGFREGFADECDILRPCPFGQFCSTLLGRCLDTTTARDCTRRAQCPAGQICDKNVNKCIPDPGCYGDEFCDEGEICDLVSRVCRAFSVECVPCRGATNECEGGALCQVDTKECLSGGNQATCTSGEFCDPLGRCVQCTRSDQCGPGLYCNTALGRCDSNVQCAVDRSQCPDSPMVQCILCTLPQVCNARTKRCEAPALECESDVNCPGDQFCDLSRDPPVCVPRFPDCLDDLLEGSPENDGPAFGTVLDKNAGPLFAELKLCQGDVDWYRIDATAGTYLTVDARFDHEAGDLDVQLYLPDGVTLLDESRTITNNERVELEVGTDLSLLVKVFLQLPSITPVPYQLIVAHDPGTACPDDSHEPDDSIGDAKDLVSDRAYDGRLCAADPDWFALRGVPAGRRINLNLTFNDALGDLDMAVYRPGSPVAVLTASSMDDNESLSFTASYSGDYFIRVFGKAADKNVYTLRADIREQQGPTCADDQFEPNDHPAIAIAAPDDTGEMVQNLSICSGDEDWYVVNLGPGEELTAEIGGFVPPTDLELKLYAPMSTSATTSPIKSSNGVSGREFVAWRARRAGDYLVRVHGRTPRHTSPYEFVIRRNPPFICQPDMVDMQMLGSTMMDAWPLDPAPTRLDDLTICTGDEDWFSMLLPGGFRHSMRIHFNDADATLDMAILDPNGGQLAATAGSGVDFKEIVGNVPGVGFAQLFMRVFQSGGDETRYSVVIDSVPLAQCFADTNEPSDLPALGTMVTTTTVPFTQIFDNGLTLCSQTISALTGKGDEDWFILLPGAENVRMSALLEHAQGDLFLEMRSPGGFVRACPNFAGDRCYSDGNGLSEQVAFTSTTASEAYYLRVGSIYGEPGVQVRPPDADTPYTLRVDFTQAP